MRDTDEKVNVLVKISPSEDSTKFISLLEDNNCGCPPLTSVYQLILGFGKPEAVHVKLTVSCSDIDIICGLIVGFGATGM